MQGKAAPFQAFWSPANPLVTKGAFSNPIFGGLSPPSFARSSVGPRVYLLRLSLTAVILLTNKARSRNVEGMVNRALDAVCELIRKDQQAGDESP